MEEQQLKHPKSMVDLATLYLSFRDDDTAVGDEAEAPFMAGMDWDDWPCLSPAHSCPEPDTTALDVVVPLVQSLSCPPSAVQLPVQPDAATCDAPVCKVAADTPIVSGVEHGRPLAGRRLAPGRYVFAGRTPTAPQPAASSAERASAVGSLAGSVCKAPCHSSVHTGDEQPRSPRTSTGGSLSVGKRPHEEAPGPRLTLPHPKLVLLNALAEAQMRSTTRSECPPPSPASAVLNNNAGSAAVAGRSPSSSSATPSPVCIPAVSQQSSPLAWAPASPDSATPRGLLVNHIITQLEAGRPCTGSKQMVWMLRTSRQMQLAVDDGCPESPGVSLICVPTLPSPRSSLSQGLADAAQSASHECAQEDLSPGGMMSTQECGASAWKKQRLASQYYSSAALTATYTAVEPCM